MLVVGLAGRRVHAECMPTMAQSANQPLRTRLQVQPPPSFPVSSAAGP
mgnify:CR=1 FL=1